VCFSASESLHTFCAVQIILLTFSKGVVSHERSREERDINSFLGQHVNLFLQEAEIENIHVFDLFEI
jgi:hypothetical protein